MTTSAAVRLVSLFWVACILPASAAPRPPPIDPDIMGIPAGPWPYVRKGAKGLETYLIPSQLEKIRRFPEPERSASLRFIRQHQAGLSFLDDTIKLFFPRIQSGRFHAIPEYAMDLEEVVMGVAAENAGDDNPLAAHEPLLLALPPYSRVLMLAPQSALPGIRKRLVSLGLADRVRLVVSQQKSPPRPNEGVTRWVRDVMFVTHDDAAAGTVILTSLAHKNFADVADNDLAYLTRIGGPSHHVLRAPLFFRGGNLLVASRSGRTVLLVGSDELEMNRQWFAAAFGFSLPANAFPEVIKAAAGVEKVIILPNSRTLFHLDAFIAPLAEGMVGLLAPVDPERLPATEREVIMHARDALQRSGFQVVAIPTSVEWMKAFRSPANIVSFTDRRTGRHRALVPQFPERNGHGSVPNLNAKILAAYRNAGIDPIPVEDRFYPRGGNTHCALVALH